ncbi:ankyrin repeat domain-containing protein 10a isoform X2 [Mustelus asterias]
MLWVKLLSIKQHDQEVWIVLMSLCLMGLKQIILERGIIPNRNAETATGASWKPYSCGIECAVSLPLSTQGIPLSLRNANGLTAAELALAQGFHQCSQFLCSVQNHQLNGFYTNGIASNLYRDNLITDGLNGYTGTNRKRSHEESEHCGIKKPRIDDMGVCNYMDKVLTNQPVTNGSFQGCSFSAVQMNKVGDISIAGSQFTGGFASVPTLSSCNGSGFQTDGTDQSGQPLSETCGSLHHNGSPGSCVAAKPMLLSCHPAGGLDGDDPLQYGHYHGFGDTAESIPDLNSFMEHSSSVKVEQSYNNAVCSAVHLFHGS